MAMEWKIRYDASMLESAREALLVLLASAGTVISLYFTALAYRWVTPDSASIPAFCRMGEQTCATVIDSPRARMFGLPNSLLGLLYYAGLLTLLGSGRLGSPPWIWLALITSAGTVGLGAFLTYSLLFLTRIPCRLCFTSHAINLVLFILLLRDSSFL